MNRPDVVHGAWARRSASIEGGLHFETQTVIWLQAGSYYADLRVPFHPGGDERCFTGRSFWDADQYRWTHDLDLEPPAGVGDDVGELAWADDALVERGLFPTADGPVAYEEIWTRLPGDQGPAWARSDQGACLVRVGNHSITVVDARDRGGSFTACYRVLEEEAWRTVIAIGDAAVLPDPATTTDWDWRYQVTGEPV